MQLVIEYSVGDGCSWACMVTVPVEYDSPEAFAVDFEQFCWREQARSAAQPWAGAIFAGLSWKVDNFFDNGQYYAPDVMTVDEWFEQMVVLHDK